MNRADEETKTATLHGRDMACPKCSGGPITVVHRWMFSVDIEVVDGGVQLGWFAPAFKVEDRGVATTSGIRWETVGVVSETSASAMRTVDEPLSGVDPSKRGVDEHGAEIHSSLNFEVRCAACCADMHELPGLVDAGGPEEVPR